MINKVLHGLLNISNTFTATESPPASTVRAAKPRTPRKRKTHFFVTFSHWSMVVLLALSLYTGMRLGWGYIESWLGGPNSAWSAILNALAPKGSLFGINLITLHVTLAFLLLLNVGIYVCYMFLSGASRRMRFTGKDFKSLGTGLRTGAFRGYPLKPGQLGKTILT